MSRQFSASVQDPYYSVSRNKRYSFFQEAELPQFTIMGWETNERKIKLATGTYQVRILHCCCFRYFLVL